MLGWTRFARNLFLVLLASVITMAGLAGMAATRQARELLVASLRAQGDAVAAAVARSAYVPLSLEDAAALEALLASYAGTPDLVAITILDPAGGTRAGRTYRPGEPDIPVLAITAAVLPVASPGRTIAPRSAGTVRVSLSRETIERRIRRIATFNLVGGLVLSLVVLGTGLVLMRQMVGRMRDLVGEARLARELKQANEELEAFSYSVSHDLRAPLRTVDGFSHIVLEDYGDTLDAQGRDYLNRIRAGCQRMGRLIDDLLGLSRVMRHDLKTVTLDLVPVALAVVESLRAAEPGRTVEFTAPARAVVTGDPGLLRAVLDNLLGNAWKFTAKQPGARVEFAAEVRSGETICSIRDNGAGFDMAYAGKLFGAFQRLHAQSEFTGTGIGLATVQRIVRRHGGRVWAEGAVGRGAAFFFSLPTP